MIKNPFQKYSINLDINVMELKLLIDGLRKLMPNKEDENSVYSLFVQLQAKLEEIES